MKNDYKICGEITIVFIKRRKEIDLECLIDTEDLEKAKEMKGTWRAIKDQSTGNIYAAGYLGDGYSTKRHILMHRWLTASPKGMIVDHFNHNTLDNRRIINLRVVTHSQNQQNRKGAQRNSKSGIRGVTWNKKQQKWTAQLHSNGKNVRVGSFSDIKVAEKAVIEARSKLHPYSQDAAS